MTTDDGVRTLLAMRLLDAFFAARPLVLIPAWSFFLLGVVLGNPPVFPARRLVLLSLVLIAIHLLNQVVDFHSDLQNDKGFFLQRHIFTRSRYVVVAITLLLGALGVAWAGRDGNLLLTFAAVLGLAYNLPPLRLSHRPIVDLVANALGYGGVATLLGHSTATVADATMPLLATTTAVGAVFLHTTLLDVEGDRRCGKITTGVFLGARLTRGMAAILATAAAVAASMSGEPLLWGPCCGLALLSWFAGSQRVSVWSTAFFAAAAAIAFWWFGLVVVLLALCTRAFYRWRFDLRYPSF